MVLNMIIYFKNIIIIFLILMYDIIKMANPTADLFANLLVLTASEVKQNDSSNQVSLDISGYKNKIEEIVAETKKQIGEHNLAKLKSVIDQLNKHNFISKIVQICFKEIQNITKDGIIDLDDTSYFLDTIRQIYEQIDSIQQVEPSITKISTADLLTLAGFLLKIVLVYTIKDPQALASSLRITKSAILLISFSLTPKTISCNWKCC
jgi:hypothetical protein